MFGFLGTNRRFWTREPRNRRFRSAEMGRVGILAFGHWWKLSVVSSQSSVISRQPSALNHESSVITHQRSALSINLRLWTFNIQHGLLIELGRRTLDCSAFSDQLSAVSRMGARKRQNVETTERIVDFGSRIWGVNCGLRIRRGDAVSRARFVAFRTANPADLEIGMVSRMALPWVLGPLQAFLGSLCARPGIVTYA